MAAPVPSDKVKDKEYTNWLKVTLALYYMKSGLHTFIENEVDCLHESLVHRIYGGQTVPLPPCTKCDARHVKRNKFTGVWEFQKQCRSYCSLWLYELLKLHKDPKSEKIYWDNSLVPSWPFDSWECAKVFMPKGQQSTNAGPTACDAQALLTLMASCTHFHSKLSPQGLVLTHTISTIRNKVMHNGEMQVSDADRMSFIQLIIQLLEDPKHLMSLEDCKAAVGNIHKIDNDSVDVFFSVELEMTALRAVVNELRQELGMQEKTNVDRADSLKEEYTQLTQQLTKKFEDVVKELELHGDSTTQRFEDVEKKLELQGESTTDRFEDVEKKLKLQGESTTRRFEEIEKELELRGERVNAVEENLVKLQEEFGQMRREKESSTKRRPESDGLRQLKNQTEDSLDTFRKIGFIPTTQTMEAKKLLQEKKNIVIKGNPGEGKTSTAFYLMDTDDYKNQRVVVKSPKDWKKVDTDWVKIVLLEDIFGQYDLKLGHLQTWIDKYLQIIQSHVDVGKLQVIFTIREDIHLKAYSKLKSFRLFFSDMSLTLSSEKLKHSDKMSILDRVLERNNEVLNVDEKLQCIANFSGFIGFPQCCFLFVVYKDLFGQGPKFFTSPKKFLVDNIRNLNDNSFLSLALLFCSGEIEEEYLSPSQKESKKYLPVLKDLASYLNISFNNSTTTSLRESYDHYSGLYVSKVFSYEHHSGGNVKKSCIQFSHATIYEAVGQVLGDKCPEMVVKYCESGYLYGKTYTAEAKDDTSQNVYIPVAVYGLLVERIIHDVVEKQLVKRVVKHSALRQWRFLKTLKDELHTRNRIQDFLMADMPYNHNDLSEGKCFTFLQYVLQNDKDVVSLVYEQFLEFLICAPNNYSSDCWQCKEKHSLLELALYYDHFEIVNKLIDMDACYTHVSLCNAARYGDNSRVQTILEDLKWRRDFKPECCEAKKALCRAYLSGKRDVIETLLQEGITLDSVHVVNVVQHGDINVLRKVVEHLKCHNKWNPDEEQCSNYFQTCVDSDMWDLIHYPDSHLVVIAQIPCSIALYITYCNEKFDMAHYLLENEVKVSPNMLYYVSAYSSVQAVASVIHSLKVSSTWNPHCDDSSKALEKAYSENRHDVHDLLTKEGVSLTMKNFPGIVKGVFVLLESVKKALQYLKDTDNWDSKCRYAFEAFEKAYRKQKDDVCNLLVQEGVSLTMKDLSGIMTESMVSSESLKIIIHHLKDTDSWDPKCTDASKALEKAYGKNKYDVCDLLVQEGVSLTMKHLPYMILRSLDYVKGSVKWLKDTGNWDPKCNDAYRALEKAYCAQKYGVCDLLIQEGVTLTMKNLPYIILRSLDDVKRSVKQLKDTACWDPTWDLAFKALEKAFEQQKYEVCDLLIQEGVLPMIKNLPFRIQISLSEDNVKTYVKLLKYIGSWDPKCNDAFEALGEAYNKHWYEVCDLLVQEGVSLTMKHLPCMILRSIDYVKTVINHLKDTDSWDPKCDHACEALEKAYGEEMYFVCDLLVQEGVSLTMKNLLGVIMRGSLVPLESVRKAIQHLKDTGCWDPKCDDGSSTLERVYWAQKYDVCDLLVQEGVSLTMKNLIGVIIGFQVSLESVDKAIQHLKDTNVWDPKCDDASRTLQMALEEKKYDVCDLLVKEGVSLTIEHLPSMTSTMKDLPCLISRSLDYVKASVYLLKCSDSWNPKCDDAAEALEKAYCEQKYNVCDLLVWEGVSLTMKHLPYMILRSVDYVKAKVKQLKDTDNWDPTCNEAFKALEDAFERQKFDICDLLVQEGVSITAKHLPYLILRSVDYVKISIKHFKDTDSWDPKCNDAFKALEKAYCAQKYDVCDLLVQEGVSLTMKKLSGVIMRFHISLESVKKAIQHLKDMNSWDPKCDDASETLEEAVCAMKYDICDLLVQEGVSLAMKNLLGIITRFKIKLKSVKKAILHLKDTNHWDPKCVEALKALKKAYEEQKYDICDLLIQEGVSLTMKNLIGVVEGFHVSLESVEKAIQYLKDTKSWDARCGDASETLKMACEERNYVLCDLLLQEGVSLSMKHLPSMTATIKNLPYTNSRSLSLGYVKALVYLMKCSDSWDPKCEDATKALEKAYCTKKYDICALLLYEGVSLTMKHLSSLIMNVCISFESIEKAIQHLKDTNNWDPKCDDASEILEKSFRKQRYGVCDLLVEAGVSLTMKNVPDIILRSVDEVRNSLKQLKDSGRWDPKCNEAFQALRKAYCEYKNGACDLLIKEGVPLTMKHLPCMILGTLNNLKGSVQQLKYTDSWDPNCDEAFQALEQAYEKQKYDVCDLLVQEGVSLTMKHLPYLILRSVNHVKISVKHLKDTNGWDPKSYVALEAFEKAYSAQKYDICDLLVQEGLSLPMKYLPYIIFISIDCVQTSLKHWKDSDSWNPNCYEALKALKKAYCAQKYDVCDLLVQEGVTLSMKQLPYIILRSVVHVQISVKKLKDTNSWDPKCDDALEALTKAYSAKRFDLFDLLVQEGVALTMKYLPNIILRSVDLVKMSLKQLKDTNGWDPKSYVALEAFKKAYSAQKYDICDLLVQEELSLPMKYLPYIIFISIDCVKTSLKHWKDSDSWNPNCYEALKALEKAYRAQKYDVCDLLVQAGVSLTMKKLSNVITRFQISLESIKKAIQHSKDTSSWDPKCDDASRALEEAYCAQKYDVCDLLVLEGISLTMKNLSGVIMRFQISLESINKAIQHLKDTNHWDPKCDDASKALEEAYCAQKYDVCDLLVLEGISLTMKNLSGVIMRFQISLKSINKAIQHLKDTNHWDPKCDDASKALEEAYCEQKYYACDLLVQGGVSLAMKNLSNVLKRFQISQKSISNAIQHLRDINSWDPKCDDALEALTKAYSAKRFDLFDLLVQEGVALTMTCLPYIILRSVDLVKMSLKQLKDTNGWDAKSYVALEAFEKAYSAQKYDICDLLVQEGLSLPMKYLPYIIFISIDCVKTSLKHWKDSNIWNPKCYEAMKALKKAYEEQKYDICDLLVQEGVSLTMKNLLGVAMKFQISLESVTKAIQHLKDTNSWDPKCDDASKALEEAYEEHKYDLCDLLVQEGVTLTMKQLPYMIFRSLGYVEMSVRQLKDSDIWDPKCDDASKALEWAYCAQKYGVCDLLTQEGVSLTVKNLPSVIMGFHVSLESVKRIIQHLKDINSWDPKCDDVTEALKMAYAEQKYDFCDLLVLEGVLITMKDLPHLSLAKCLDHWDPKSDEASRTLEQAFNDRKYDVCDLLVQEGVSLTMKHLSYIILRSLDYLKISVKQLKDTNSWDPKCDEASKALEQAYSAQKYDICDLLVQEGVSLTMKLLLL